MNPTGTQSVPFLCWQRIFTQLAREVLHNPVFTRECARDTSFYQIVKGMLPLHLQHWLPLLSMVMPSVEFGGKIVTAMAEENKLHEGTPGNRDRFVELCIAVLDWFTRRAPTIIVLHIKQVTSFFVDSDPQTWPLATGV